jgi:glyoxylase-like metal-dependent hydrolase (beta-lactamase superfamily II)
MRRLLCAACVASLSAALTAQQPPLVPDITRITGNLYRGHAFGLYNIFLVTPAGIILTDPINTPYATWLKAELAARFPVSVKYVVYSHGHYDHIEGGSVFADTATFVAHENLRRSMDGRLPQMPGGIWDANRNGRIAGEGNPGDQGGRDCHAAVFRGSPRRGLRRHVPGEESCGAPADDHAGQIPRVAGVPGTPSREYRGGL